ncbi:MAG: biotin transporter BioY [Saccharofermentanales bacterium]|jgi:biotin transport system substrate-specific component|nr:biotin transporter BioY [Clostridiaceae bacterium]
MNHQEYLNDDKNKNRPTRRKSTRFIARVALMAVVIMVCSLIRIPVGPVPITLQTFGVLLAGILLDPAESFFSVLLHLVLKIIIGGWAVVISPSFGFVLVFVVAAPLLSLLTARTQGRLRPMMIHIVLVSLLIYFVGLFYMMGMLRLYTGEAQSFSQALTYGVLIFIPGDIAKATLACLVGYKLYPHFSSSAARINA